MNNFHSLINRAWRPVLVSLFILGILAGGTLTHAQEAPEVPRLSIGPWTGVAHASGTATTSGSGVDFVWNGSFRGNLSIIAEDETSVRGTWTSRGASQNVVTASGEDGRIDADLTFSGTGSISGSPEILLLNGTSTSTGTATVSSSQGSITNPVGNESEIGTIQVNIVHAQCDEAYGDWVWAIEQQFEEQGFLAELDGSFMAVREETEIQDQLEALAMAIWEGSPPPVVESPLFDMIGEYILEINAFIDEYPNWSMDDVMNLMAWAEFFLNELRNLRSCDLKFFGEDNVEYFVTALTFQVQQLIIGATDIDGLDGSDILQLMEVASRVGAFGPGAPNPFEAVQAEEALRLAAQEILEANLDPEDNRIIANEDTIPAMLTGAIMDWTFFVGGLTYNARETYGTIGQDWQADANQPGGGS